MKRIQTRRKLVCAAVAALALQSGSAFAMGLLQAYDLALQNDPTYRSAIHERDAGKEAAAIGRSALLPQISASYSESKNRASRTTITSQGPFNDSPDYISDASGIQLRQPLVNPEGYARYFGGIAQANYSDAAFAGRAQDLMVRVAAAYADAQYAEDNLKLAIAQRDTFAEQKYLNQRMFEKGEGTKTDMLETQSKYDLAVAQVLEAEDHLLETRNALAAIVGTEITGLDKLSDDFEIQPMQPTSFDEWKAIALEHNSDIAAQRYAVESTRYDIDRNRAGHFPRVDAIASYSKSSSESLSTLGQSSNTHSFGLQINIPIYSGGYVNATTNQAIANHERAKSDLDDRIGKTLVDMRKQFNAALSSRSRIAALMTAVDSATLLVKATKQSVKGGTRINVDVLNAQQQLFSAQRDLAQARYSYLLALLRLRYDAGVLSMDDLQKLARFFKPAA